MADRRTTFIQKYMPYAQEASALTGIDPGVILAQAAHETGWGRAAPGNNFFGIKGKGQSFGTHEYVGGKRVNMKAGFRRYDDPRGSFLDWAKLMQTPRYAKVLAAKTPEEQIQALKDAGYATDPAYVSKLNSVRNQVTQIAGDVAPLAPAGIGGIMDVAALNDGTSTVPNQPTAAQGYAPDLGGLRQVPAQAAIADLLDPEDIDTLTMTDEAGNYLNQPSQVPMPQMPPQWAQATGFPIDEALTGASAQDVLMGGPRMDPRRVGPATGPMPPDMGAMRSPADVLAAGPRIRPGGAPDASMVPMPAPSPMRPAVGGPNDRRPQPPTPPSRAQGIPDPRMRPDPASLPQRGFPEFFGEQPGPPVPLTDDRRQQILADLDAFRQRDEYSPMVAGMPDIPRPQFQSRIAGRPEFPGAIQPPPDASPPQSEPRVPASSALTPELMDRLRQSQGIGPFSARPEFPGALPAAPNPYDDPSRQFDIPGPFTRMAERLPATPEAGPTLEAPAEYPIGNLSYTDMPSPGFPSVYGEQPPALQGGMSAAMGGPPSPFSPDFGITSPAPPIVLAPPSPNGPIGNVVAPNMDGGSGRQAFIDANRSPPSPPTSTGDWMDLPDPTPQGMGAPPSVSMQDQFDVSFAPGGPGVIMDLNRPPSPQAPPSNPFAAMMGPGAAMGALPFNDVAQGMGSPNFSNAAPPSPWDSAPTGDLGLGDAPAPMPSPATRPIGLGPSMFYGDAIGFDPTPEDMTPRPGRNFGGVSEPAAQSPAQPPTPVAQSAVMGLPEPAPAPRQTNVGAERQRSGIVGRVLGGLLGGPIGALGGGLLGGGGGGFGFGTASFNPKGGGGSAPYGNGGTTTYQKGTSNALGGSNALSWKGSGGQTITAHTDPWTGQTFHSYGP